MHMLKSVDSWMLPVVINGVPTLALVDSGASATMISRAVYEKMSPGVHPLRPTRHPSVTGVGGGKVGLQGEIHAKIQIAGQHWPLDVSVSQRYEPVDCYLGMDFFSVHKCDFSVQSGAFEIGGKKVQMEKEGRRGQLCARIKVQEDFLIPPEVRNSNRGTR